MNQRLKAPFPWYGGKGRVAAEVWRRLGNPTVFVEPFAGSLAVLLGRPGGAGTREVVCDIDGGLCNAWRALASDPEEVAYWADYPTIHEDLIARHRWLVRWLSAHHELLCDDPDFYDARAAGWWLWGISLWIGGGWCQVIRQDSLPEDRRPHIQASGGGRTVNNQAHDKRPYINHTSGGQGVSAQRRTVPDKRPRVTDRPGSYAVSAQSADAIHDRRPAVHSSSGQQSGMGVSAQRVSSQIPRVTSEPGGNGVAVQRQARPDLLDWFGALQERLFRVVVLNRDWTAAVTPTVLMHTPSGPKPPVGVFFDPPYLTDDRAKDIYQSDRDATSDNAARVSYEWAIEHGDKYRIAYCAHADDFEVPAGWTTITSTFSGIQLESRRDRQDLIMFSPMCVEPQPSLFEV